MPDILIYRMKMPESEPLRLVLNPNGQLFIDHVWKDGVCVKCGRMQE